MYWRNGLSKGDLYTILINRYKRGRKGSIIAVIQGTKTDDIIAVHKDATGAA